MQLNYRIRRRQGPGTPGSLALILLSLVVALLASAVAALVAVFFSRSRYGRPETATRELPEAGPGRAPQERLEPGSQPARNVGVYPDRQPGRRPVPGNPIAHDISATLPTRDAETQPGGGIADAVERTGQGRTGRPVEPVEQRKPVGQLLEENEQGPEPRGARQPDRSEQGSQPPRENQAGRPARPAQIARQSVYAPEGTAEERADWYRAHTTRADAYHEARYRQAEEQPHRGYESRQHQVTTNWYALAIGVVGLFLVAAPFIFAYEAASVAFWSSIALGGAIAILAALEYLLGTRTVWERAVLNWAPYQSNWQYWSLFMLGALTFFAPWVLVFVSTYPAFWVMEGVGLFVLALAGSQMFSKRINYPTI